jgi:hypothetical protein
MRCSEAHCSGYDPHDKSCLLLRSVRQRSGPQLATLPAGVGKDEVEGYRLGGLAHGLGLLASALQG